jgi:hypothetical protein
VVSAGNPPQSSTKVCITELKVINHPHRIEMATDSSEGTIQIRDKGHASSTVT